MAEIIQKDGTWTFDGESLRLTPGRDKGVGLLRATLGELTVPLAALAGISLEQGRRNGRLRLRLRDGADPLIQATRGGLSDSDDPYRLTVESDRLGVAEYLVEEVRTALLLNQVPSDPVDTYLLPGPAVPLSVSAGDGAVSFDGENVRLTWGWKTDDAKAAAGARTLPVADITAVRWQPSAGLEHGFLRFTVRGVETEAPAKYDPHAVELWGFKKDPLMALVAAAVQARLPHPSAPAAPAAPAPPVPESAAPTAERADAESDHDALLRRLRELGELHRAGVLTEEEFTVAKQAVLKRM
ncbi:DUF4429 domain-containing protein [Streptomyces sp. RY43-2]|uniref:DUF4429 domain-containing protein n=1 Tax=Streptomyces macrolidinus TaxID=2952607 RepID=A0ABT0Z6E7_9ACTN|nr:DUF4429 domain-containing protein [Streptomyces macrolidinus]MCN9239334.1 DUF4429 domain-containing protein [Streptomyces macrolidinus]